MTSTVFTEKKIKTVGKSATVKMKKVLSPPVKQGQDPAYFSRSVGKAFLILNVLSRSKRAFSLSEIADVIGLTKSSCFRLLFTLQSLGYLSQPVEGRFIIAEENWIYPGTQIASVIPHAANESIQRLSMEFRETISLAVLFSNHIEVVLVKESPQVIRMANTVGRILPPHASSLGKAIAAFQTLDVRNHLLQSYGLMRLTAATITDEVLVRQELEEVLKHGIAKESEESTPDGCCFGCPIFHESNSAVAAISISMPKSRLPNPATSANFFNSLKTESQNISQKLRNALRTVALSR
jgi:IclR family acetate operon transcriptional repressor